MIHKRLMLSRLRTDDFAVRQLKLGPEFNTGHERRLKRLKTGIAVEFWGLADSIMGFDWTGVSAIAK